SALIATSPVATLVPEEDAEPSHADQAVEPRRGQRPDNTSRVCGEESFVSMLTRPVRQGKLRTFGLTGPVAPQPRNRLRHPLQPRSPRSDEDEQQWMNNGQRPRGRGRAQTLLPCRPTANPWGHRCLNGLTNAERWP